MDPQKFLLELSPITWKYYPSQVPTETQKFLLELGPTNWKPSPGQVPTETQKFLLELLRSCAAGFGAGRG